MKDQAHKLRQLFKPIEFTDGERMGKVEFARMVLDDAQLMQVEFDLPQGFIDSMQLAGRDISYYVWSFMQDTTAGAPLNLAELFADKYARIARQYETAKTAPREYVHALA